MSKVRMPQEQVSLGTRDISECQGAAYRMFKKVMKSCSVRPPLYVWADLSVLPLGKN